LIPAGYASAQIFRDIRPTLALEVAPGIPFRAVQTSSESRCLAAELNEEMKMKTRIEPPVGTASDSGNAQAITAAADFHSGRRSRESKSRRKYANPPVGNYEYEQMVAEDAAFRSKRVSEAAYFLAERRGFASGEELRDWLQAETQIEELSRAALVERRRAATNDRRGCARSKA
jgi:hypothetical protein